MPGLDVVQNKGRKEWHLSPQRSAFTVKKDWMLTDDIHFPGSLSLASGVNVTLSQADSLWQPHTLSAGAIHASGSRFSLAAGTDVTPGSSFYGNDRIDIARMVSGDSNPLQLLFVNARGVAEFPASPAGMVLASAP
ncbi:hypothetical protein AAE121_005331, partial [Salmonella enterica]